VADRHFVPVSTAAKQERDMSPLLISLGAGVLIGLLYALLNVRSPAPPAIALVGLLGMLLGGALMHAWLPASRPVTTLLQPAVSGDATSHRVG